MSRKPLGRGLEVFFSRDSEQALFQKALDHDRKGEVFEAFHLYMKVAEQRGTLRAKALNNAAVILAEHGFVDRARALLREALQEDAGNREARENLSILEGDAG
uniref:Tetratricopeptide repeat protein n=1 Tax=Candidatus Caldatribacterium saccharofermentans TaxID=1454753 RepID=A0A7V4TIH3_9BACT